METLTATLTARKLRYTPLLELLHGRVTGRLDWRRLIASANLPADVTGSVTRIVRRTRLSWREKLRVAEELVDHFDQGIASGKSPASLLESFGDEKTSAKLIRRAKLRARPLWRRTIRRAGQAFVITLAIFVLTYGALAARFYTGTPTPAADPFAAMNRTAMAIPAADRAWPIFRDVLLKLGRRNESTENRRDESLNANFDGPKWSTTADYVRAHATELVTIRSAVAKPALGFVNPIDGVDRDLYPPTAGAPPQRYWYAYLPVPLRDYDERTSAEMTDVRTIALLLSADARLAEIDNDPDRFFADIQSLLALSKQIRRDGRSFFNQTVAVNTWDMSLDQLDHAMANRPAILSDDRIRQLAHELSVPQVPGDLQSASADRDHFDALIQYLYTDDGNGDGRVTPAGWAVELREGTSSEHPDWKLRALGPLMYGVAASRETVKAEYEKIVTGGDLELVKPLRLAGRQIMAGMNLRQSVFEQGRYLMLFQTPTYALGIAERAERLLGRRDGLLVAMSLEIHHRRHGSYPATLVELTPDPLPAIPADRITGEPIKYRFIDGKPILYSVGADRIDDGGTPVKYRRDFSQERQAADWETNPEAAPSGDWILFPRVRTKD